MARSKLLDGLNPPQLAAVTTESGPLLVLAGAGTGKTRVVTYRIARLVSKGTPADRILAVTFTNKAADEMLERVTVLLGTKRKKQPFISTFHSLCVDVLRRHIRHLGYPDKFSIYAAGQQEGLARRVLREINIPNAAIKPSELLFQISSWKSHGVRPHDALQVARTDKEHLAAAAYRKYQTLLKSMGAVDFDDLLLCTEELFSKHPEVRRAEADRFDHIMIDEYQDTNASQYRIIRAMAAVHRNLCVVGDDDQSIYGWRGADVQHILRFGKDWPEAKMVKLVDNYRSTEQILMLANRLIAYNNNRYDKSLCAARLGGEKPRIKQFDDETIEAEQTVEDIRRRLERDNLEARDIAILFRTNEQTRAFESALRQAKLPYVLVGGLSFYDRKEIRDVLAYIKVLDDPRDEPALLRILNTPARGIGDKTAERLMEQARDREMVLWDLMKELPSDLDANAKTREAISQFVTLIETFQAKIPNQPLNETVTEMILGVKYKDELKRVYEEEQDQQSRWNAIEEIVNGLAAYEQKIRKPTLNGYLNDLALRERDQQEDKESKMKRNAIVLMTLHAAKGLEFPHVYMVGMEEGILPHQRSIGDNDGGVEEERRLCYVGITRAQETLTLSMCLTRRKWGKAQDRFPSRFLFEIAGKAEKAPSAAR
jgi:DNA helicase-2/ATP-dependent DNA helicase PcrA